MFGASPAATSAPAAASTATASAPAATVTAGTLSLGATPAQSAASRLKNKSMDEILTRWATDLAKHQKEFQKQAQQVAAWDRLLVENADQISKLVTQTFQAERDAAEVERQLSGVESQQQELEQWLDKYEKEADDLLARAGLSNETTGTDVERERT
jgi:nuclear pore complex protein Nup62